MFAKFKKKGSDAVRQSVFKYKMLQPKNVFVNFYANGNKRKLKSLFFETFIN